MQINVGLLVQMLNEKNDHIKNLESRIKSLEKQVLKPKEHKSLDIPVDILCTDNSSFLNESQSDLGHSSNRTGADGRFDCAYKLLD